MKRTWSKYLFLFGILVAFMSQMSTAVVASEDSDYYIDSFPLQTYDYRMYVVSLEINQTIIVNVTSVADGDFDLFLFSTRPQEANVSRSGYEPDIYNPKWLLANDNSTGETFSNISYTPTNPEYPVALYYIQVVLIDRGPDSYILEANHEMELYFIPFIPGYPILIVSVVSVLSVSIIFFRVRKKKIQY